MNSDSQAQGRFNFRLILVLTLVHFTGDFYSSFTNPLLPVFVGKLSLSLAQVGILTGTIRILAFIVQPCVGYLADQYQTRAFILAGLVSTVVFLPLSGLASGFLPLLGFLAAGSIGSSMFHPSVTGMVPLYSGSRKGLCLSVFNTGGTMAFALGPVFIAWFVARYGLEAMPVTMVLGLACIAVCLYAIPMPVSEGFKSTGFVGSIKHSIGDVWRPISLIWIVMVLRAVTGQSFMTFMPIWLARKGYSLISVGYIVSLFILGGTLSGLTAGYLSDRIGYKKIFMAAHALMAPALILYLVLPGQWVYAGAFMAGFFALATLPLGVGMAQILAPRGRSMVSSLMMGLAYGLGGITSPVVGYFSDRFSIDTTLMGITVIPVITLFIIAKFPDIRSTDS
ncbi:MAG: MFS transporter [Pseudomonadota bacterium]